MAVADYSDRDMALLDRLGPKAREVINNSHRILDVQAIVQAFNRQRKVPDPIEKDGNFYPAPPLPPIYSAGPGDDEFAEWIAKKVIAPDLKIPYGEHVLKPVRKRMGASWLVRTLVRRSRFR